MSRADRARIASGVRFRFGHKSFYRPFQRASRVFRFFGTLSGSDENYEVDGRASQILVTPSAKLPSYSGVKWCRFAHEEQAKRQNPTGFKDFVQFVKQEAEVANDPVFSPDALKRERNKATNTNDQRVRVTRPKRRSEASTDQSFFSFVIKPGETSRTAAPLPQITPCPVCEGNHSAVKCHKILNASPVEKYDILSKGLCFRCAKLSHVSRNCPSKVTAESAEKDTTPFYTEMSPLVKIASPTK